MILDLKRIFAAEGSRLPIDYTLSLADFELYGNYPLKNPVSVKGEIFNKAGVVNLALSIKYTFSAPCDRCGKVTNHEHTVNVDKMLAASLQRQESDTIIEVPGMKIDVGEFLQNICVKRTAKAFVLIAEKILTQVIATARRGMLTRDLRRLWIC